MAHGLVVLIALLWGLSYVATGRALRGVTPLWLTAGRFVIAALILWPLAFRRSRPGRAELRAAAKLGLPLFLCIALSTAGVGHLSAGRTGLLAGAYAVFTPLLAALLRIERLDPVHLAAAAVAGIGLGLLSRVDEGGVAAWDLAVMASAIAASAHLLVAERLAPRHDALRLTCLQIAIVGLLAVPTAVIVEGAPALQPTAAAIAAFIYLVTFSTIGALGLQIYAQCRVHATTMSLLLLLEAPFAAAAGAVALGERLDIGQCTGAILIVLAGVIASRRRRTTARRPTAPRRGAV